MTAALDSMDLQVLCSIVLASLVTVFLGWKLLLRLFPWINYDIKMFKSIINIILKIKKYSKQIPQYTIIERFVELANTTPNKTFIYFEEEVWTYGQVNNLSNRVARLMHEQGMGINKTVAMMTIPRPELIGIWFGIAKTGATTAFINYNIRKKSLLHLVRVSKCKILVISNEDDIIEAISEIEEDLKAEGITVYVLGDLKDGVKLECHSLLNSIESYSKEDAPLEWRKDVTMNSQFCYVYTSGTTGLPKAAILQHIRTWLMSSSILHTGAGPNDVIYTPLPLYHTAGLFGIFGTINVGCSIVIRRKFSASHFWEDCRRYKVTVIQYIGETLRYVCAQPPHPEDRNHCVRAAMGNGLRPVVWKTFIERYGKHIRIVEFYASTEGNCGFFNIDNNFGSIGLYSPFYKAFAMLKLVQYDKDTNEPIRDSNGRCIEVPNETPGILLGRITSTTPFHGYCGDKEKTEKKILRNVVKDGDAFFNTGDLLCRNTDYYMHFVDRLGDTFRWKGENVSTNEVADVMSGAPGVQEASVYGVEIEGSEGRAGMMVAVLEDGMSLDGIAIYQYACENLASYARPLFIRVKNKMEVTGTFKYMKGQLVKDGFEPKNMGEDKVYFMDCLKNRYVRLTEEIVDELMNKTILI